MRAYVGNVSSEEFVFVLTFLLGRDVTVEPNDPTNTRDSTTTVFDLRKILF